METGDLTCGSPSTAVEVRPRSSRSATAMPRRGYGEVCGDGHRPVDARRFVAPRPAGIDVDA